MWLGTHTPFCQASVLHKGQGSQTPRCCQPLQRLVTTKSMSALLTSVTSVLKLRVADKHLDTHGNLTEQYAPVRDWIAYLAYLLSDL